VAASHDRDTSPAGPDTSAGARRLASLPLALDAALDRLRLEGAVFLRAEYRQRWAYESMTGAATAAILRPGTDRVILFHVVATGTCWVSVGDGEKHWMGPR
jgi:hypothetical protein